MYKFIFSIAVIALLFLSCATISKKLDKDKLNPVSKNLIDSYDEEGKISIFVPPELAGVKIWGSFATVHTTGFDDLSLEQAVNQILSPWNFNEYLLNKLTSSLNDKCTEFKFIHNEEIKLTTANKNQLLESVNTINENSEFLKELIDQSFDALLLLKLRYYGPHTTTAFSKCRLRCTIDLQLISIPSLKILWKDRINLEKIPV